MQKTADDACASVAATLSKNPDDVPFAVLYLIDPESKQARLEQTCGIPKGVDGLTPELIDLGNEHPGPCLWPFAEVVKTGSRKWFPFRRSRDFLWELRNSAFPRQWFCPSPRAVKSARSEFWSLV